MFIYALQTNSIFYHQESILSIQFFKAFCTIGPRYYTFFLRINSDTHSYSSLMINYAVTKIVMLQFLFKKLVNSSSFLSDSDKSSLQDLYIGIQNRGYQIWKQYIIFLNLDDTEIFFRQTLVYLDKLVQFQFKKWEPFLKMTWKCQDPKLWILYSWNHKPQLCHFLQYCYSIIR